MKENELAAQALYSDPKIQEAKKLLLEAVKEHQTTLTQVRPPNPALKQKYEETLSKFANLRGAKLFFPYLGSGIGNGPLVELLDGSVKYDFICGIGPHYLGHSNPEIIDACIDAALGDTVMQGNLQQNADALAFCEMLTKASSLDHCFLSTTGAMANENTLKIAFQKKFPASRILAFDHCFVGRTLAVSQITDKPSFREGLPLNYFVDYVPFFDPQHPEESTAKTLATIKTHIERYPKQHAIMILELVQGEGGFNVGSREFFKKICELLKENNIAIFADEVQTFGRTPELFAFQHFGLQDYVDLASIGKVSQVCATLYRKEYTPRPGLLSQTFIGSTSALQAGKRLIEKLLHENYFGPQGKIVKTHDLFVKKLEAIAKRHPKLLAGPYGIGAMVAFTPLNGDNQLVPKFVQNLFEAGVMSFVAGSSPTRVRFLPPIGVITEEDIDKALKIVEETLIKTSQP